MIIEELYINSFGSLKEKRITLEKGLNIIQGQNESGKSTVFAFIKFMFYGVARANATKLSERQRYMNWNESSMGGTLTLLCDEGHFRIERKLSVSESGERASQRETVKVINLDDNQQYFKGESIGEHFFGVPESVFVQTALMGQLSDGNIDGKSISEAIENILFSGDENISTKRALAKLDGVRRGFLHKHGDGGKVFELKNKCIELKRRLGDATEANSGIIELEGAINSDKRLQGELREKLGELSRQSDNYQSLIALQHFNTIRSHEKRISELGEELERLKVEKGADGKLPERDEIAEMKFMHREIVTAEGEETVLSATVGELRESATAVSDLLEKNELIEELGGEESVLLTATKRATTAKVLSSWGVICAAGAVCVLSFGIGGYFLDALSALPKAYIFGAIALLVVASAVLFVCAASARRALTRLCESFGIKRGKTALSELRRALRAAIGQREDATLKAKELERLEGELALKRNFITARRSQLSNKLSAWVLVSLAPDDDGVIKYCEQLFARAEDIARERETLSQACNNLKYEFKDINEKELRASLEGIDVEALGNINITALQRERDFISEKIESLGQRIREKSESLAHLRAVSEDPASIFAELERMQGELAATEEKSAAYQLAIDAIGRATDSLRSGIAPRLGASTASLLEQLTSGRYSKVGIDPTLSMSYEVMSGTHSTDYMSSGTKTSAYIALRISLIRLLYTKTLPPMAFDESLAHLDDERSTNMLSLLSSLGCEGLQSIIFTCHDREAKLADGSACCTVIE